MRKAAARIPNWCQIPVGGRTASNVAKFEVLLEEKLPSTCQQGSGSHAWQVRPRNGTTRWQNPLTGWTSSEQPHFARFATNIEFLSSQAARSYCERSGLDLLLTSKKSPSSIKRTATTVISGALRKEKKPKSYGDNFSVQRRGIPIWPPV